MILYTKKKTCKSLGYFTFKSTKDLWRWNAMQHKRHKCWMWLTKWNRSVMDASELSLVYKVKLKKKQKSFFGNMKWS